MDQKDQIPTSKLPDNLVAPEETNNISIPMDNHGEAEDRISKLEEIRDRLKEQQDKPKEGPSEPSFDPTKFKYGVTLFADENFEKFYLLSSADHEGVHFDAPGELAPLILREMSDRMQERKLSAAVSRELMPMVKRIMGNLLVNERFEVQNGAGLKQTLSIPEIVGAIVTSTLMNTASEQTIIQKVKGDLRGFKPH